MWRCHTVLRVSTKALTLLNDSFAFFFSWLGLTNVSKETLVRGSHCLYVHGFRFYFTPLPGFFSPFPHGTGSLSVGREYLALEGGPPIFRQDFSCPVLLVFTSNKFSYTGLSPCIVGLSRPFY